MTQAPERIWVGLRGVNTHKTDMNDVEYMRLSHILAILDAHPNASPGWLALQIREGKL